MRQALILLLAFTALSAAMVPRQRRAHGGTDKAICAKATPCAWAIYRPRQTSIIDETIPNSYCECAKGMVCEESEDNRDANALIFRCRVEGEAESS